MREFVLVLSLSIVACSPTDDEPTEAVEGESLAVRNTLAVESDKAGTALVQPSVQVIGRWCDKLVPTMPATWSIYTIRRHPGGNVDLHLSAGDGSEGTFELVEEGIGNFRRADNTDRFRIIESSGDLEVSDANGFIGGARRLENRPQSGECYPS